MIGQSRLVIGATGKTGRRVAERLRARNLPVRLGSRSGEPSTADGVNNALAAVPATGEEGAGLWSDYLAVWTRWNHVRTIAALAAAAAPSRSRSCARDL